MLAASLGRLTPRQGIPALVTNTSDVYSGRASFMVILLSRTNNENLRVAIQSLLASRSPGTFLLKRMQDVHGIGKRGDLNTRKLPPA